MRNLIQDAQRRVDCPRYYDVAYVTFDFNMGRSSDMSTWGTVRSRTRTFQGFASSRRPGISRSRPPKSQSRSSLFIPPLLLPLLCSAACTSLAGQLLSHLVFGPNRKHPGPLPRMLGNKKLDRKIRLNTATGRGSQVAGRGSWVA
jgi:hypothetical protein